MKNKKLENFLKKINKACKDYEDLIVPYGSYTYCKEFIKQLHNKTKPHDSALAEFIINLHSLYEEAVK